MTTPPPADPNLPPQQPQYQPVPPVQQDVPLSPEEDVRMAALAYTLAWIGWIAFLGPLIIWLMFKGRGPRSNNEGKEALNFGITVSAAIIVVNILFGILAAVTGPHLNADFTISLGIGWIFSLIGWLVGLAIIIFALIWSLKGRSTVIAGGAYRYPFAIRFIK